MNRLTIVAALIVCLFVPVPASAQSYLYHVVNTYAPFTPGMTGPQVQPILEVRSAATLDLLASLGLGSTGSATDIVLGAADRRAYVSVQGPTADVSGALYIVDTLSNTIAKTLTFATGSTALALVGRSRRLHRAADRIAVRAPPTTR